MLRGVSVALLFSALPFAVATPAAGQGAYMPAEAVIGASTVYPAHGRYVLVDAASARLYMVEDGEIRDSMRVIVGKPDSQTPTIASKIYYATLNPYWNVTPDLVRTLIAPNVLSQGFSLFKLAWVSGARQLRRWRPADRPPHRRLEGDRHRPCHGQSPPASRSRQLHGPGQVRLPQQ